MVVSPRTSTPSVSPHILAQVAANKRTGKRTNIVLDLDNTLISSVRYANISDVYRKIRVPYHVFNSEYIIYERPGTQRFLDFLFRNFDVSVWSAASKDYVMFIVNNVIARGRRKPKVVLHAEHCTQSAAQYNAGSPKDLRYMYDRFPGFTPANTFIIDDLDAVYLAQPHNCIHIPVFDVETQPRIRDNQLELIHSDLARALV